MVALDHPNIRQVFDYAELDGQPAIIQEYLEGNDLKSLIKSGKRFSDAEMMKLWNDITDALNYTHSKGIVHRDIKPSNIFITDKGVVKILDFGIAKIKGAVTGTQTGQKMGTLIYMSPEQIKDSKHIDYKTDVYSLAVTFVHLLKGQAPYDDTQSSEGEIMNKIVSEPLDMNGVPGKWEAFLTPYLAKNPTDRPVLVHFGGGEETVDETSIEFSSDSSGFEGTIVERPNPKPKKKNLTWLWVLLAVLVLGGGFAIYKSNHPTKEFISNDINVTNDPEVAQKTFTVNGVSFEMVAVKGGTFTMGATSEQGSDAESDEVKHSVTLSDYYIGKFEVTQELWQAVMGNNPSRFKGNKNPVESVSWNDCQNFIRKLNQLTGQNFRLPTEAEWEYAARGGNKSKGYKYSGSNIISDVAWYWENSEDGFLSGDWNFDRIINNNCKTHAVGTKSPNELGIYDMTGNVCEWCQDWYGSYGRGSKTNPTGASSGSYRVLRGGGWSYFAQSCRVSYRDDFYPDYGHFSDGFRLVQ